MVCVCAVTHNIFSMCECTCMYICMYMCECLPVVCFCGCTCRSMLRMSTRPHVHVVLNLCPTNEIPLKFRSDYSDEVVTATAPSITIQIHLQYNARIPISFISRILFHLITIQIRDITRYYVLFTYIFQYGARATS